MRKLIVFALFVVSMAGGGYAREMPETIKMFMVNYIKDSAAHYGVLRARRVVPSIQIEDLSVRVLEMYRFKHVFLGAHPDTVPFSEFIEPSGYWRVLVMARNKPLYELYIDNSKENPKVLGSGSIPPDGDYIWDPFLEIYPEPTEVYPILFSRTGVPYLPEDGILYFRHKNPRKIRYLRLGHSDNPQLLDTLSDSRELMRYWKRKGLNEVGISDENRRRRAQEVRNGGSR